MFPLHVLTATSPFYEGMCESLIILPTVDGRYGVLSGHSDTICAVVPGELYIRLPSGEMRVAACAAGIMKVEKGDVLVLVDSAIRPEDIDKDRARRMRRKGAAFAEAEHRRIPRRAGAPCACARPPFGARKVYRRMNTGPAPKAKCS